jgi:DNA invertase Pin-like site-specific DNA recombinase
MMIGYARTSTVDQQYSLDHQRTTLIDTVGCDKVFEEQVSSVGKRLEFEKAIEFAREGDFFVVTKLDRFARSITDLWNNVERLRAKGVELNIVDMNLDTSTPTGKLLLSLMGSIAEFEREILLERQRVGIAKAKAEGKYKGRKPKAREQQLKIQQLTAEGKKPKEIARLLEVSIPSVYKYRKGFEKAYVSL